MPVQAPSVVPLSASLPPNLVLNLAASYSKFATELLDLHKLLRAHCQRPSKDGVKPRCLSCTLEVELSYMRLRETRPRIVWEISPMHGFTSLMILSALQKNNNSAHLHSFDRHIEAKQFLTNEYYPTLRPMWSLHQGDVSSSRSLLSKAKPDYLFLDSWHSEGMGSFYVDTLLPHLQTRHTFVSLHDVYNPLFWTDEKPQRDLDKHPGFMPNLEGGIVLDWLAYPHLSDSCRLFTAAPSKRGNAAAHKAIFASREAAGIKSDDLLDPHKGKCPEPTIWFEIGCRKKDKHKEKGHHTTASKSGSSSKKKHGTA